MKDKKLFIELLFDQKAGVRLTNMLHRHAVGMTLADFIDAYPVARLQRDVFGFGPKARAELLEILARPQILKTSKLIRYLATLQAPVPDRTCVHCGCTDSHACAGGCSWVILHKATHTGVCSACVPAEIELVDAL